MQKLLVCTAAHWPSFAQHSTRWSADSTAGGLRSQQLFVSKRGKYRDCKAGLVTKTGWRCCSLGADAAVTSENGAALITTEMVPTIDEAAVEEGPTAQVKFVLKQECEFGQSFNVVGNDPLFGNWNPETAVPMAWEDGHIWSVAVDVPVGKQFEFKFVLTGPEGEVEWQPGPNHFFETVEGVSPLVMAKSWDSADDAALVAPQLSDGVTGEAASVEAPELSDGVTGEAASTATPDLSGVDSKAGLQNVPEEEAAALVEGKVGDLDEQPPLSVSGCGESSTTGSEIPLAEFTLAAVAAEDAKK